MAKTLKIDEVGYWSELKLEIVDKYAGRELHGRTYDNMPFIGARQFEMPLVQIALP